MIKCGRFIDTPDRLKIFYPFITAVLNRAIMERLILIDMSPLISADLFLGPDSEYQPQIYTLLGILGIQYASG